MTQPVEITTTPEQSATTRSRLRFTLFWDVFLIVALVTGAYFRLSGINWDEYTHLHPDERFLTMVEMSIRPPENPGDYFNTATSTLNPHNVGHTFFVYGTLPIYLVYMVGQAVNQTGYDQIHLVGRYLSTAFDIGTLLLTFLIASRLYRRRSLAALATAFLALAVLPIQLSHFFAVDTFTNFFIYLAIYYAVRIMTQPVGFSDMGLLEEPPASIDDRQKPPPIKDLLRNWGGFLPYALFGIAFGTAMASKVSSILVAALLPLAAYIWWTRLPQLERMRQVTYLLRNMIAAGLLSFIVFRIAQPYAFMGPGLFGLRINELWLANLREIGLQSSGVVDFPPALQWSRRPIWFAWQNLTVWGLGLPLGISAWIGFLWMGWRIIKGQWKQHILLWSWVAVYFAWQSINFTRAMRYQLLVYPGLAIMAAWAIVTLWERGGRAAFSRLKSNWNVVRAISVGWAVLVLVGSFLWAFAFTRIYARPFTRAEATRWIYQNVPAPVNLQITTVDGTVNLPLGTEPFYRMAGGRELILRFTPVENATLADVSFEHIVDPGDDTDFDPDWDADVETLNLVLEESSTGQTVATGIYSADFLPDAGNPSGRTFAIPFDLPTELESGKEYQIRISLSDPAEVLQFSGGVDIHTFSGESIVTIELPDLERTIEPDSSLTITNVYPRQDGLLESIYLNRVVDRNNPGDEKTLVAEVYELPDIGQPIATAQISSAFAPLDDLRGEGQYLEFSPPVEVQQGTGYELRFRIAEGEGALVISGNAVALETSWDDPLPQRFEGFDPFPNLYRGDLNFEMYWDDNEAKLERFISVLDEADYLFLSSNRQWGTTVRVPERYPLTTAYYRNLIGCPPEKDVFWCFAVADPGTFSGNLGFELIKVFESYPTLGNIEFNDQFAEEAFSVYDHPKVMIFRKTDSYNAQHVRDTLGAVDLSNVVHLIPGEAGNYKGDLMLPQQRLARQQAGGTWSDLFNTDSLINKSPVVSVVAWYLLITILGWTLYPFLRIAMSGLGDRGYPFARLAGMLVLAYVVWLLGSLGIASTRLTIGLVFAGLLIANLFIAIIQRKVILAELRQRRSLILWVEILSLAAFLLFLLVRIGNPDLWHPYHGGEKPMDFAYWNSILKSVTFPPYDPWFAGGYINYYYYGLLLVGVPVKWLGINPSVAYNLVLPTLFSFTALGAFSLVWNIASRSGSSRRGAILAGSAGAFLLLLIGNLGTVRMLWHGFQRIATEGAPIEGVNIFTRWGWTFQGLARFLAGENLPYGDGAWYWDPSRAIIPSPGLEITEFPLFTFLYGDLHAHLIVLPVTLLVLGIALAILYNRWGWRIGGSGSLPVSFAATLVLAGLAIGSLRPMNTWDMPTYFVIVAVPLVYTAVRYSTFRTVSWRYALGIGSALWVALLAFIFFLPFARWYGQAYSSITVQTSWHTPFPSYLVHWGIFLFILAVWLFWETRDWMATTPMSALNRLRPYRGVIWFTVAALAFTLIILLLIGIPIALVALPMAAWAAVLILRPNQTDAKRAVLFLIGSGFFITLAVEVIVLKGDINRMNTVFKFYMQVWTMLSISSAAALFWLYRPIEQAWLPGWRNTWQVAAAILLFSGILFPLTAGPDKIRTRMSKDAPHGLDGMAYMLTSTYWDFDQELELVKDYRAIRWMQENIQGSPVIVEANAPLYHWGSRYSIYTGLPSVIGWDWHQIQQRTYLPQASDWVRTRIDQTHEFYRTTDLQLTEDFLRRYDVKYIILGELEQVMYTGEGLAKFDRLNGELWHEIYRDGEVVIYEVNN